MPEHAVLHKTLTRGAAALVVCAGSLSAGQLLEVAPAGAPYHEIAAALAAAGPGDLVLVQAGSYAGFTIDGQWVDVVAATGADVLVTGPVRVQNLAQGQQVLLRGLQATVGATDAGFHCLRDNLGPVWIEDCVLRNASLLGGSAKHGLVVEDCAAVHLVRSECQGALAQSVGSGLLAEDSSLALFECALRGGVPVAGANLGAFSGGDGLQLERSVAFASATLCAGSSGGDALNTTIIGPGGQVFTLCPAGGAGGDGVELRQDASLEHLLSSFSPGSGGAGASGCTTPGAPGAAGLPLQIVSGTALALAGCDTLHSLRAPGPTPFGTTLALEVSGAPGELVVLFASFAQGYAAASEWCGLIALGAAPLGFVAGWVGPSGALLASVSASAPLPGLALSIYLEALFLSPTAVLLGTPSALSLTP